ncbi:tetratricopeptide repeat protein [Phocaeicola coprophilus]|nr:tetratricopeptide repeat protein [Phocaeicola coprophilus]
MKNLIYIIVIMACVIAVLPLHAQDTTAQSPSMVDTTSLKGVAIPSEENSVTKAQADSAYAKGDYVSAIELYESILANQGESAAIYYNLGNSYYKNKDIAHSILNYERAYLLSPGDSDIRFNLEMARNDTVDKIDSINQLFLMSWITSLRNSLSADGWAGGAIISFIIFLLALSLYIFGKQLVLKKLGLLFAGLCLIITIVANIFASQQKSLLINRQTAIIMSPSVTAKSTPDAGGTDLFILHEGHKILVKDATMKDWCEIQLEDGSIGWIPRDVIEII